jgi:hypothetical protein
MSELLRQSARDQESTLEWTGINCSPAVVTTQFHSGSQSVEAAAIAAAQTVLILATPWVGVTADVTYTASAWIRFEQASRFPAFLLRFSNSGNNFLGDFQANPTPAANTWTSTTISGAAPAGATAARIELASFGMSAGEKFWLDDASLTDPTSGLGPGMHVTLHSP